MFPWFLLDSPAFPLVFTGLFPGLGSDAGGRKAGRAPRHRHCAALASGRGGTGQCLATWRPKMVGLMGFHGDLVGFHGDFIGFYCGLVGFNRDLSTKNRDVSGYTIW